MITWTSKRVGAGGRGLRRRSDADDDASPSANHRVSVVSHTPGRMRVRVSRKDPAVMARLRSHLEAIDGVSRVETNPATGSLLVHYDRRRFTGDDMLAIIRDVGAITVDLAGDGGDAVADGGRSVIADSIIAAAQDLDARIGAQTGWMVNLRVLLPLALAAAGVRAAIAQGGLGLTSVPPFLLLWFALDSFISLRANARTDEIAAPRVRKRPGRA